MGLKWINFFHAQTKTFYLFVFILNSQTLKHAVAVHSFKLYVSMHVLSHFFIVTLCIYDDVTLKVISFNTHTIKKIFFTFSKQILEIVCSINLYTLYIYIKYLYLNISK